MHFGKNNNNNNKLLSPIFKLNENEYKNFNTNNSLEELSSHRERETIKTNKENNDYIDYSTISPEIYRRDKFGEPEKSHKVEKSKINYASNSKYAGLINGTSKPLTENKNNKKTKEIKTNIKELLIKGKIKLNKIYIIK
jgi:hypothetical protein